MSFVLAKTGNGVRRAGPQTHEYKHKDLIKTSEATKRTEQNYLIYSIEKLPCRPSKKCTWSCVYVHKLTGSVSLNDLVYNSREIWCTALLWSPNRTLWPKPFGPVTARVHACTRFVSSRLNSRRLDEPGCVCVMRQSGVMSHLGSGRWDSWGHLLWEEFTCPSAKMASRWLDGQGIYGWTVAPRCEPVGKKQVWKRRFNVRSFSCVYGRSVWPYRWRISLAGSSSFHTRWDEVGGPICPVCASLPKTFMKRGKGETAVRWSISRCSHERDFSH